MKTIKLKNKQTGEIGILNYYDGKIQVVSMGMPLCGNSVLGEYETLAELCEKWTDYEDPTDKIENIWTGNRRKKTVHIKCNSEKYTKEIFLKLKALKRLEDKGFRFTAWKNGILLDETVAGQVRYEFPIGNKDDIEKDLDFLFPGGEE